MANTPNTDTTATSVIRAALFAAVLAATAGTIIFLKHQSDIGPITPEGLATRDSINRIARPDTSTTTDLTPIVGSDTADEPVDSLSADARTPDDAGYEDGYFAGISDAILGNNRTSYDPTSSYRSADDRAAYSDAYCRGYEQGYADGLANNQQSPDTPDDTPADN